MCCLVDRRSLGNGRVGFLRITGFNYNRTDHYMVLASALVTRVHLLGPGTLHSSPLPTRVAASQALINVQGLL